MALVASGCAMFPLLIRLRKIARARKFAPFAFAGDGPNILGGWHFHTRFNNVGDCREEGLRRYGCVEFRWQQHIRCDRRVSVNTILPPLMPHFSTSMDGSGGHNIQIE